MEMEGSNEITNNRNLNDLPEDLLLHILTFLPTLNSVQTSLISHKWLPLWSRVPSLNFNFQLFPPYEPPLDTRQLYTDFVDRVLISRSDSPIHTFCLSLIYHYHYRYHVDSWVRSAVTHFRARELYFDFFINKKFHNAEEAETEDHDMYDFPFSGLRNGCVEKLSLTRCYLNLPANLSTMRFGSIASMVLDDVYLTDQMVENLILGCPNLDAFEIVGCRGPIHLKICSKRLKRLRIVLGYYFPDDPEKRQTFLVDCPNICSINLELCAIDESTFKNVSSLVEFRADFVHRIHQSYHQWSKVVRVLEQAPNLKILNVQNWWFKVGIYSLPSFLKSHRFDHVESDLWNSHSERIDEIFEHNVSDIKDSFPESFMLHNLKILELRTGFTQYDLVGIAALLKLCPNLETIILVYPRKFDPDESLPEELLDKPVEFSIPSLKQVTIKPYTGTEDEGKFVKILTEQGVVLEKIVLVHAQVENRVAVLKPVLDSGQISGQLANDFQLN